MLVRYASSEQFVSALQPSALGRESYIWYLKSRIYVQQKYSSRDVNIIIFGINVMSLRSFWIFDIFLILNLHMTISKVWNSDSANVICLVKFCLRVCLTGDDRSERWTPFPYKYDLKPSSWKIHLTNTKNTAVCTYLYGKRCSSFCTIIAR